MVFADPPTVERRRRAGERSSPLWYFDAELLCVVVWLFDLPAGTSTELTLRFDDERAARLAATVLAPLLSPRDDPAAAASAGALVLVRRAQAAKSLLDGTYPQTQPQDYLARRAGQPPREPPGQLYQRDGCAAGDARGGARSAARRVRSPGRRGERRRGTRAERDGARHGDGGRLGVAGRVERENRAVS